MRSCLLFVLVWLCACAGASRRPEGAPSRVVVLGVSVAQKPGPQGLVGNMLGEEEPREVVTRAGVDALRARGFTVLGGEGVTGPAPTVAEATKKAREYGADAAVVLVLTRLDLSSIRPLGRAEVALEWWMVDALGQVLSNDTRRATTTENLYRARNDWRSHVRQAVNQAVRELR